MRQPSLRTSGCRHSNCCPIPLSPPMQPGRQRPNLIGSPKPLSSPLRPSHRRSRRCKGPLLNRGSRPLQSWCRRLPRISPRGSRVLANHRRRQSRSVGRRGSVRPGSDRNRRNRNRRKRETVCPLPRQSPRQSRPKPRPRPRRLIGRVRFKVWAGTRPEHYHQARLMRPAHEAERNPPPDRCGAHPGG